MGWLHLSNLEIGHNGSAITADLPRAALERDLRAVHDASGPWDFVAITGDLTRHGEPAQFEYAADAIERLWQVIRELGSYPPLVMVPGPRDAFWPRSRGLHLAGVTSGSRAVSESAELRRAFAQRFSNFAACERELQRHVGTRFVQSGIHPGDSSRSIARGGLQIGVLGLNTCFRGGAVGHVESEQIQAACRADVDAWARHYDAVFVVAHHGGSALTEAASRLLSGIDAPVIALCGAQPRVLATEVQVGGALVLPALKLSEFEPEVFGYSAGRLAMAGERAEVRLWSRCLLNEGGGDRLGPRPSRLPVDVGGAVALTVTRSDAAPAGAVLPSIRLSPPVHHLSWSPDGAALAAISERGQLAIHRRDGAIRSRASAHATVPCAVAWGGAYIATRSRFHLRLWQDGLQTHVHELACPAPAAMAWLDAGRLLLGSDDGVYVYEPEARAVSPDGYDGSPRAAFVSLTQPAGRVLALAWCAARGWAAVATDAALVILRGWAAAELSSGTAIESEAIHALARNGEAIHALAWNGDGSLLATGSGAGVVAIWTFEDAGPPRKLVRLEGLTSAVRALSFSRDHQLLAATAQDGSCCVWSVADWAPMAWPQRGDAPAIAAFSPREDVIAVGRASGLELVPLGARDVAESLATATVVRSASAKVVLLGEGNAGKSCLALRLTQDRYEDLGSTHGMKFWSVPLERLDPDAEIPLGERREVVFWDMGGQNEYRLLHRAFLRDTTIALMVMEPRRGEAALRELEGWTRRISERAGLQRILIGSKLDDASVPRDPALVAHALADHRFTDYVETSAKTSVGIAALRKAIARSIDWQAVTVTTRPELFQRIRRYIELRREARRVVIPYHELVDIVQQREGGELDQAAIGAVVEQLARQGLICEARLADKSRTLILEVEQVERYAASLIIAARDNPRGVPALELASVISPEMVFPRITAEERLSRDQEIVVLECVLDILIESGICFRTGRLVVFPALFRARGPDEAAPGAPRPATIAYDFVGPADNIYSSLVCWLAMGQTFGPARLHEDRVELSRPGASTCGLRRVVHPTHSNGEGRFEIYFDDATDPATREFFVGVVDDFLRGHGVELVDQLVVTCACGYGFPEELVRHRVAQGTADVGCPRCDARVPLLRTAAAAPGLVAQIRAFRTETLKARQHEAAGARLVLEEARRDTWARGRLHLLHLSDLHIDATTDVEGLLLALGTDLDDRQGGFGDRRIDLVVVSGDLTNRASPEEFEAARRFVAQLLERCKLTAERCIVVPGNHDLSWDTPAYDWVPRRQVGATSPVTHIPQGAGYLVRNERSYPERFRNFSDHFFHPLFQRPYALRPQDQGQCALFADLELQVLALNSAWQIDEYFPDRAAINPAALTRVLGRASEEIGEAREAGRLGRGGDVLRIAVWHHPITGNEKIADDAFVDVLRRAGVRLCLHGHVHEDRADLIGYLHPRDRLHVLGAGSFGAPMRERPESTPRLYNVVELGADRRSVRVHTRKLSRAGGTWEPWYAWPGRAAGERSPCYEFELPRASP